MEHLVGFTTSLVQQHCLKNDVNSQEAVSAQRNKMKRVTMATASGSGVAPGAILQTSKIHTVRSTTGNAHLNQSHDQK